MHLITLLRHPQIWLLPFLLLPVSLARGEETVPAAQDTEGKPSALVENSRNMALLERVLALSPEELNQLSLTIKRIEAMSPEEREAMRDRVRQFNRLREDRRERVSRAYDQLTPEQRQALRRFWADMSEEEAKAMREKLAGMDSEARRAFMRGIIEAHAPENQDPTGSETSRPVRPTPGRGESAPDGPPPPPRRARGE
jgi:hypothetical protein